MKKLLFLIVLTFVAVSSFSQSKNDKQDYSMYQPCEECFEQWKVTESNSFDLPVNPNKEFNNSNTAHNSRKPFNQTYIGSELKNSFRIIIGGVLTVATAIILVRVNKPSSQ